MTTNGHTHQRAPVKSVRFTTITDAAGNAVFNLAAAAFASPPVVATALQTADTGATEARVTDLTATSCTINVRRSAGVTILGITVLGLPQALAGATVHLFATPAGVQS